MSITLLHIRVHFLMTLTLLCEFGGQLTLSGMQDI